MSEPVILPELDDEPKNGYWAPEVNELELTEEERQLGEAFGESTRKAADNGEPF